MISDADTDFLYLSDKLADNFPKFYQALIKKLDEHNIKYSFLKNTKDIWCRDYSPIQITKDHFVQFRYDPDYLDGYDEIKTKTNTVPIDVSQRITFSSINLDGGNVVRSRNKVILTDKIFRENPDIASAELVDSLRNLFLADVVVIPHLPYDIFGHSDGMVRFYDENTVLASDFTKFQSKSWVRKFRTSLEAHNLKIIEIPYTQVDIKNDEGIYPATGCYINFLHVGKFILVPVFSLPEDEHALKKISALYPDHEIQSIFSEDIANEGGVLNCISWTIQKSEISFIDYFGNNI